jgi:dTDP-4-amino-4,6-dideoxygalactose transaminase
MTKIPLIKPYITEEVKARVCEVLDSGYLTEGHVTDEFKEEVREYVGAQYALAVSNCTVGLELALRAMDIGPGDEVIIPDYTYPATGDAVQIVGAKAVIVDIDPETCLVDYQALQNALTSKTKAVIPVSLFGNPLDYERLKEVTTGRNIFVLEDAACSLGARYDDVCAGNLADISVFSLHPRKFITTGEGGVVTTDNTKWAGWMESYKHFGVGNNTDRVTAQFERIGTNYKLSNIQAAVGLVQMRHIDMLLARRAEIAQRYNDLLQDVAGIRFLKITPKGTHSWQSYCVFVENPSQVIEKLRERGIETQIGTYSLHMHSAFNENPNCQIVGDMPGSRYAFEHCLCLPLYHEMNEETQAYVVQELAKVV